MRQTLSLVSCACGRPTVQVTRQLAMLWCLLAVVVLVGGGCSEQLEGPKPAIEDPTPDVTPLPVEPGIICRMQQPAAGLPIVLTGEDFSPLAFDLPDHPTTALPSIFLRRSHDLDGADAELAETPFGGEPGQSNADLLSWQSQTQMTLRVTDALSFADGSTGMLPIGLHDLVVVNPNGHEDTSLGTLAVTDRPRVDGVSPGLTCIAQGERTVTLTGQTVLRIGANEAVVRITNADGSFTADFAVDALAGCTPVAHPGLDAELCDTVTFTLHPDDVPVGFPDVLIQNPQTAGCVSVPAEDQIGLRVVPPPTITAIAAAEEDQDAVVDGDGTLICVAGGARDIVIHGTDFLTIDDGTQIALPGVTLDGTAVLVKDVGGACESLPASAPGWSVQRCTRVTVELPTDATADAPYNPIVAVTNPEPAGCSHTTDQAATLLTIVPAPVVSAVVPPAICSEQADREVVLAGSGLLSIDGELASVTLDGASFDVTGLAGCVALEVPGKVVDWCTQATIAIPLGSLPVTAPDTYLQPEIIALNPMPAGCSGSSTGALTMLPAPTIASVEPPLVCSDQADQQVVVHGTGFVSYDGTLPTATVGGVAVQVDALGDCVSIQVAGATVEQCASANVTIPAGSVAVPAGDLQLSPQVVLTNPDPVGCDAVNDGALTFVPPPSVTAVVPPLACVSEADRALTIEGFGLLRVDAVDPIVDINGVVYAVVAMNGCAPLTVQGLSAESCTSLDIVVAQGDLAPGPAQITIINPAPADCSASDAVSLVIVPPPTIVAVQPPALCDDGTTVTVTISGSDFLTVDAELPIVDVGGVLVPATDVVALGCVPLAVAGLTVEQCDTLEVQLAPSAVPNGSALVTVSNPAPAGCSATTSAPLDVVAPPTITSVTPALACANAGNQSFTIDGDGFYGIGGVLPTVTLGGATVTTDSVAGCAPATLGALAVSLCTSVTVMAAPGTIPPGDVDVVVTNPAPVACTSSASGLLSVPPAPTVTAASPAAVCTASVTPTTVTLTGAGFLDVDGVLPELTLNGNLVTVDGLAGCTALPATGISAQTCTELTFTVAPGALPLGDVAVGITNPAGGCAGTFTGQLFSAGPPTIGSINPTQFCDGDGGTVRVTGTSFTPGTEVFVDGPEGTVQVTTTYVDATTLDLTFAAGMAAGSYDVRVRNGGCEDSLVAALDVLPSPLVFFVDPPVLYNGITVAATIFTTGLSSTLAATNVELIASDGTVIPITTFSAPVRPNRIQATIPAGLAPDTYAVSVTSANGCTSALTGTLPITDTLTLALTTADPAFVSPTVPTAVTLSAKDAAALLAGEVQFESTPRAYLNPSQAGSGQQATAMRAVVFESVTTVTAVVPDGLPTGVYDLIVVNPSGAVGLIAGAITVTAGEPPFVRAVSPGSFDAGSTADATLYGANLEADISLVQVDLECRDFATGAAVGTGIVTVTNASATALDVTIDAAGVPAGSVCLVTVTNSDGAAFRYSAISFKEPAQNLNPWQLSALTMHEARRGLALAAGRPTFRSRFIYAMGGDDGVAANAKTSVEAIGVDAFGQLDARNGWVLQRNDLGATSLAGVATSTPRSFAGVARIGRFVYLTGGSDGIAPTDTLLRAQILDPLDGPEIADLDAFLGDGTSGLDGGLWFYRVAALFPDTDPSNPGGESLPGEVLNVQLPSVPDRIVLTLSWTPVPGAVGYRVYRSPAADGSVDALELLAELAGNTNTSLQDDGSATDPTLVPLPPGAIGVWHGVNTMGTPRQAHATVAVDDPADPSRVFLYAIGGLGLAGPLDSGEFAVVSIAADGSQTVGTWTPLTATLSAARSELGGFVVTPADTTVLVDAVPGDTDTFVYLSGGRTATGNSGGFDYAEIGVDGQIATFAPLGGPTPSRVGAGCLAANGWMFVLGGANRSASNGNDTSNEVGSANGAFAGNWDALGAGGLQTPRIYMGAAEESAFFFIAGGATNGMTGAVSDTIELTVQ